MPSIPRKPIARVRPDDPFVLAGVAIAGAHALQAYAQAAEREYEALIRLREAALASYSAMDDAGRWAVDPHRFRREVLWSACTPGAYLWMPVRLGMPLSPYRRRGLWWPW